MLIELLISVLGFFSMSFLIQMNTGLGATSQPMGVVRFQ
jgi:hypothetical protein